MPWLEMSRLLSPPSVFSCQRFNKCSQVLQADCTLVLWWNKCVLQPVYNLWDSVVFHYVDMVPLGSDKFPKEACGSQVEDLHAQIAALLEEIDDVTSNCGEMTFLCPLSSIALAPLCPHQNSVLWFLTRISFRADSWKLQCLSRGRESQVMAGRLAAITEVLDGETVQSLQVRGGHCDYSKGKGDKGCSSQDKHRMFFFFFWRLGLDLRLVPGG